MTCCFFTMLFHIWQSIMFLFVLLRAVELRPDLSCLWKLLGDACTTVSTVSPNRAQVLMPAPLAGLDGSAQSQMLNQMQTLKVGERYDLNHPLKCSELPIYLLICWCVCCFLMPLSLPVGQASNVNTF